MLAMDGLRGVRFGDVKRFFLPAIFALVFAAFSAAAPTSAPDSADDTAALIRKLTDADPRTRDITTMNLIRRGEKNREQVRTPMLQAARSDDPELRSRAAKILLKLPWYEAGDPPQAKQFLVTYGQLDEVQRGIAMIRYKTLGLTRPILLRLLREDPSDAVRWAIVQTLGDLRESSSNEDLRALDTSADDPPILTLAGIGWMSRDRQRGLELLQRAIDADAIRPQNDRGGMDLAFNRIVEAAVEDRHLRAADTLLRLQASRGPVPVNESAAKAKLLAMKLHLAYAAPDDNFAAIELIRRVYANVAMLLPQPCRLMITRRANFTRDQRYAAGVFLLTVDANDPAEMELRAALSSGGTPDYLDANIYLYLAKLAGERNDDRAAVDCLTRLMECGAKLELDFHGAEQDFATEIHYRQLRLAHANHDAKEIALHVTELKRVTPANANAAIEAITTLKQFGHNEEASSLFKRTFDAAQANLLADANNPILKNDLAWLCSRTNERLPEALKLATAALAAAPDNAAFMDTAADVHFRLGHREEAVKLETRALEIRPKDRFMREQLERFRSAPTTQAN